MAIIRLRRASSIAQEGSTPTVKDTETRGPSQRKRLK
jgi:hypothetical protein